MSTLYEIVELNDGDIVLRRAEGEGDPLVSISFSEEAVYFLNKSKFSIAKVMIEAGLDAVSDSEEEVESYDSDDQEDSPVLH